MPLSSRALITYIDSTFIPKKIKEALNHSGWHNAMFEKINVLDDNHT